MADKKMTDADRFKLHLETEDCREWLFRIKEIFSNTIIVHGYLKEFCPCCVDRFIIGYGEAIARRLDIIIEVSALPKISATESVFTHYLYSMKKLKFDIDKYDSFAIHAYADPEFIVGVSIE